MCSVACREHTHTGNTYARQGGSTGVPIVDLYMHSNIRADNTQVHFYVLKPRLLHAAGETPEIRGIFWWGSGFCHINHPPPSHWTHHNMAPDAGSAIQAKVATLSVGSKSSFILAHIKRPFPPLSTGIGNSEPDLKGTEGSGSSSGLCSHVSPLRVWWSSAVTMSSPINSPGTPEARVTTVGFLWNCRSKVAPFVLPTLLQEQKYHKKEK